MSAEGEMGSRYEKGAPASPRVRQTIPFRKPAIVADPPTSSSSRSDAHVSSSSAANQFLFSRQFHRGKQAVVVRSDARRRCASSSSGAHGRVRDRRRALDGLLHRLRLWRLMLPRLLLLLLLNRHGTRHRFRSARSRRPSRSVHRRRSKRFWQRRSRRLLLRRLWLGLRLRNPSDGRSALHFGGKGGGDSSGRFTFRCRRGRGACAFKGWRRRSGCAVGHVGSRGRHGGEVVALGFVHRVPVQFRLRRSQVHQHALDGRRCRETLGQGTDLGSFDVFDVLEVVLVVEAVAQQFAKMAERSLESVGDRFLLRLPTRSQTSE